MSRRVQQARSHQQKCIGLAGPDRPRTGSTWPTCRHLAYRTGDTLPMADIAPVSSTLLTLSDVKGGLIGMQSSIYGGRSFNLTSIHLAIFVRESRSYPVCR